MEFKEAFEVKVIGYNMGEPADSITKIFYRKVTQKELEDLVTELNFPFPEIRVYQTKMYFITP